MPEFVTSWCQRNATSNSSGWHSFEYGILTGPVLAKRKKEKSGSFSYITTPCWWILGTVFANLSASDWKTGITTQHQGVLFCNVVHAKSGAGTSCAYGYNSTSHKPVLYNWLYCYQRQGFVLCSTLSSIVSTSTRIAAPARCCWNRVNERCHRSKYSPGLNQPKTPKELDCRNDTAKSGKTVMKLLEK